MDLQLSELIGAQYAFHGLVVGGVLLFALLVYVFGFKSAVEPPFDKLTNPHEDRKANGKKKKPKEKKTQSNGHIASLGETKKDVKAPLKKDVEKSPVKEKSKPEKKVALKENRDTKPAPPTPSDSKKKGKGKENVEVKNKKNKQADEKPKDFDDGEWEQAPSRKDKKKKTTADETSPSKSDKKKEIKKKKEEIKEVDDEIVTPTIEEPIKVIAETVEDIVTPKPEPTVDSDTEPTEPKEQRKKNRKKKSGSSGNDISDPVVEEAPKPVLPPAPQSKPKKETVIEPIAAPEPEKTETPVIESTVVFDELGDTWKEARAPKKGGKKKSRKE
ncbi:neurofilament heavy polypeptide [Halyomorpha halys]|uniref:neurofilament heavy polypeptide n=1 Tax=Halyomorpha halys TaxID=286706 RepID=UPI0006D4E0BA|nr:proteoglycan 4-like [Halyomorpha halys]